MDLTGCTKELRHNRRYLIGVMADGRAGIWDRKIGGNPVEVYDDWGQAWGDFNGDPALETDSRRWLKFAITLVVLVGIYIFIHARRYSDCPLSIGIFDWPSSCLSGIGG